MHRLLRFYYQNQIKIWIGILLILFIFLILNVLNNLVNRKKLENNNIVSNNISEQKNETYKNESKSLVSEGSVSENLANKAGSLIDTFYQSCIDGNPSQAYDLLSKDCKRVLYPTEKLFEENYYKPIFLEKDKLYSFQSWTSNDTIIYLVKIFDNMLSSGIDTSDKNIQEYVSIIQENGELKLNINNFIGTLERDKTENSNGIIINVKNSDIYMDYEIFHIYVKNNTENTILLNPKDITDSLYVKDENGINYECYLFENIEEDLIIKSGEEKDISFKFSNSYHEGIDLQEIVFSNIILNYDLYQNNEKGDIIKFVVKL